MSDPKPKLPSNPTATLRALNPGIWGAAQQGQAERSAGATVPLSPKAGKDSAGGLAKPRGRRQKNKTEAAFEAILEARRRRGEIARHAWEGMVLKWPDGMSYCPDFVVWELSPPRIVLVETKGAWIEEDALVKFRAARAYWPEFGFALWQRKKGTWTQVL